MNKRIFVADTKRYFKELKKALESYKEGHIDVEELHRIVGDVALMLQEVFDENDELIK